MSEAPHNWACPWTAADDRWLRANWSGRTAGECAAILGRSSAGVGHRARTLGLRKAEFPWAAEDKTRLADLYNIIGPAATANVLGRSQKSCWNMAHRLGLSGQWRQRWTTKQVQRVRVALAALCEELGRSPDAIAVRMRLLADESNAGARKRRRRGQRTYTRKARQPQAGMAEVLAEIAEIDRQR